MTTAHLIDGAAQAAALQERIAAAVARLAEPPRLAVVLVGDNPASEVYVRSKRAKCAEAGMDSLLRRLPGETSQAELGAALDTLAQDPSVDGILLQLPLPDGLSAPAAIARIPSDKDVDGLTPHSAGRLVLGETGLRPCTPLGCVMLARAALGDGLAGAHVVVIGRSILVGKPAALLFLERDCTVTLAHSKTRDLPALCRQADILVAAAGRPRFVQGDWIKPGAAVIDVGINRVAAPAGGGRTTQLVGDVDFEAARTVAGHITPVPGGVGPMTVACLLRNTALAACRRRGWPIPDELE